MSGSPKRRKVLCSGAERTKRRTEVVQSFGRRTLTGWKALAQYLGVSIDTLRRWKAEAGLPVHKRGGYVFAFPEEIDAWIGAGSEAVA